MDSTATWHEDGHGGIPCVLFTGSHMEVTVTHTLEGEGGGEGCVECMKEDILILF